MKVEFVGRRRSLERLGDRFATVVREGRGQMLAVRGRRQVGKSRLLTEFVARGDLPHLFTTAVKNGPLVTQMEAFHRDARETAASVRDGDVLMADVPANWTAVFTRLRLVGAAGPLVVVFDEFPWACDATPTLEGELQAAWDRHLQHLPILLVLVGSDVATMERLTQHDRPLFGRASEEVVRPFDPSETAEAIGAASALTAFDAHLTTGGYPRLVEDVRRSGSVRAYISRGIQDENTDLVVVAQRSLEAEFPADAQARRILSAIGGQEIGHATFTSVVGNLDSDVSTGGVALSRGLRVLADQKGLIAIEHPAGAKSTTRQRRYRITDPYLRFWFRFVEPHLANIARGRADVALNAFDAGWQSWRGTAIEPVVREAVVRLAPSIAGLEPTVDVAPWWNRDSSVEVDVVASSRDAVEAMGTVKWRDRRRVTAAEVRSLSAARSLVPRAGAARLLVVCPAGAEPSSGADLVLTADDLLSAWRAD